ncbi:MurR/RpiR family transcriptional regulator [Vibrio sp. S11_S32]|uniref:MurR/RpiR family transcriptional regulator n=1 Tax=Vibrio sp. S11_S32 TaxID=2720225 RepID=UPI001680FFA4|nr:MurR/RpiR family transcriptional regulator [Vibrio sp. S11_S32]MBD1575762.1 MurR/RpiR family transcriptional regulator [Vibrio sp. S11_S32]
MSNREEVLPKISSIRNSLPISAQKVADFILENSNSISNLSIAELALLAKVGEASIIRFCKKIGYSGFQEFKMVLAISIAQSAQSNPNLLSSEIDINDDMELIADKLQLVLQTVLSETKSLLNFKELKAVSDKVVNARSITFIGVGSSGVTAEEAKNKLMRIGYNVDSISNNHFMCMKSSLLNDTDVVIAISHSGESPETIKALKIAQEGGAFTVALTHNLNSKICNYADSVLLNGNRESWLQGDSIGTKFAQMFVLDLLYTELIRFNPEQTKENKRKTTESIR